MAERGLCKPEVRGSSPLTSTNSDDRAKRLSLNKKLKKDLTRRESLVGWRIIQDIIESRKIRTDTKIERFSLVLVYARLCTRMD